MKSYGVTNSNKTSLAVFLHGVICFAIFYKMQLNTVACLLRLTERKIPNFPLGRSLKLSKYDTWMLCTVNLVCQAAIKNKPGFTLS